MARAAMQKLPSSLRFSPYSKSRAHTPFSPIRKERQQMLQLLFIDIQVGSIATGLEVAVVGKMKLEGGVFVCSNS